MPLPSHLSEEALGYRLHTNRELGMMLRHEKPLTVFSEVDGAFSPLVLRYLRMFDRYVRAGRFAKREQSEAFDIRGDRRVLITILYALPEEVWRIDAMIELRRHMTSNSWTMGHERKEGTLLGYTDAQNDAWIELRYARR